MTENAQLILDRVTTEIELIIEAAHRAVMFEPLDKYTMINFQNLISKALSRLKSKGTLSAYHVSAQVTHNGQINCWIDVTPIARVEEINISCTMDSNGLDVNANVPELEIVPTVKGVYNYGD